MPRKSHQNKKIINCSLPGEHKIRKKKFGRYHPGNKCDMCGVCSENIPHYFASTVVLRHRSIFQPWSSSSPDDVLLLWRLSAESEPLTALQPYSWTQYILYAIQVVLQLIYCGESGQQSEHKAVSNGESNSTGAYHSKKQQSCISSSISSSGDGGGTCLSFVFGLYNSKFQPI